MPIITLKAQIRHVLFELVLVGVGVCIDFGDHVVEELHEVDWLVGVSGPGILEVADGGVEGAPFFVVCDYGFARGFGEGDGREAGVGDLRLQLVFQNTIVLLILELPTDAGSSLPLISACLILLHGSLETFSAATKEARASNALKIDILAILDTGIG